MIYFDNLDPLELIHLSEILGNFSIVPVDSRQANFCTTKYTLGGNHNSYHVSLVAQKGGIFALFVYIYVFYNYSFLSTIFILLRVQKRTYLRHMSLFWSDVFFSSELFVAIYSMPRFARNILHFEI